LGYTVLETAMESCELLVNCWGWSIIPKGKVSSRNYCWSWGFGVSSWFLRFGNCSCLAILI
jgi:hypothetical protein